MKKLLAALAAAVAIGGGAYAVTASGAPNQQFVYGGGHFNVNFGPGNPTPGRDFSVAAVGSSTNANGRILTGLNQAGGSGGLSITVLCYSISPNTNASGGRTAVVGGTIDSGPNAGNQAVFFVQDNTKPGGPAGVYDQASAIYQGPTGYITLTNKGATCPDPDSTTVGPSGDSAPVLYADVPYGDIVVSG
jgi:hypothetical protein